MLPAALMVWSLAFALLPGVAGLLSTLCLVLAGLAWPWAWLALPLFWAYFLRRSWHVVGSTLGLLGGAAGCLAGLTWLTLPSIPRPDGALSAAGVRTDYAALLTNDGTLVIEEDKTADTVSPTLLAPLWRFLLGSEECALNSIGERSQLSNVEWPNGVDPGSVKYRSIRASGGAYVELQKDYRAAVADTPDITRAWVALRTVMEATYRPTTPPLTGTWHLWARAGQDQAGLWTLARRLTKLVVGLMALSLAALFLFAKPLQPYQLVGATVAVCGGTLLASGLGAVTNLAWLIPVALALLAAKGRQREQQNATPPNQSAEPPPMPNLGPAPRITVEK
jgi:hypothetical protein